MTGAKYIEIRAFVTFLPCAKVGRGETSFATLLGNERLDRVTATIK